MKQNKRKQSKRKAAGFTLAEIMISVSIIALVTAIAVPVFTRVRIGANESGARKALLTYRNAFISYQSDSGTLSFPNNFTLLGGHVDGLLAASAPQRNGYNYTLLEATAATYTIVAQPVTPGQTGIESFIITEAGTIEPLSLNVAAQLGLVNLADNFDRLDSTEVSRTYIGGSELTSDHWRLGGYEFKNLLDRAVELIIAIKNPTYGGGILAAGATLIGDGTLDESSSDDTKVDYYHLGEVGAGESLNMNEYLQLNNYDNSGGWYSRSIQAYEYNGLNVLEPVGGLTGGTNVTA